jgi:hypothetical protein
LNAQDVRIGSLLTLQEVRINVNGLHLTLPPHAGARVVEATCTLVATEKALNELLQANPPEGVRDLSLATLSGRMRIEGKKVWNKIPLPFTMTAAPEIEGGARVRLNVHELRVFGPIPVPSVVTQGIANSINDTLAEKFDVTKLPIQLRLTGLTVEPGRVLLSATAALDIAPAIRPSDELQRATQDS